MKRLIKYVLGLHGEFHLLDLRRTDAVIYHICSSMPFFNHFLQKMKGIQKPIQATHFQSFMALESSFFPIKTNFNILCYIFVQ